MQTKPGKHYQKTGLPSISSAPRNGPAGPVHRDSRPRRVGTGNAKSRYTWASRGSHRGQTMASPVALWSASRADRLRLPFQLHAERPLEQGRGCVPWASLAPLLSLTRREQSQVPVLLPDIQPRPRTLLPCKGGWTLPPSPWSDSTRRRFAYVQQGRFATGPHHKTNFSTMSYKALCSTFPKFAMEC